jgi:pimeloyl-ACP methyl ester carboxylesterase
MPVCSLSDGARMAYADEGAGSAVLLVHGWAAHGGFFKDLSHKLARTHRVLTPTLRAHPGSDHGSAPLSIETLADDIAHFVQSLELKSVTALGWSMGAMALWAAAPKLGGRLNGLVVEDMAARLVNDADWQCGLSGGYGANDVATTLGEIASGWPVYVARFAPRMFAPSVRDAQPGLVAWATNEMTQADAAAMASFWASMAQQDFRASLTAINAPMLVIHGADSPVYSDAATAFVADAAPKGERVVLSGAGHVPHLETPDAFFETIETFARAHRRAELARGGTHP